MWVGCLLQLSRESVRHDGAPQMDRDVQHLPRVLQIPSSGLWQFLAGWWKHGQSFISVLEAWFGSVRLGTDSGPFCSDQR